LTQTGSLRYCMARAGTIVPPPPGLEDGNGGDRARHPGIMREAVNPKKRKSRLFLDDQKNMYKLAARVEPFERLVYSHSSADCVTGRTGPRREKEIETTREGKIDKLLELSNSRGQLGKGRSGGRPAKGGNDPRTQIVLGGREKENIRWKLNQRKLSTERRWL